MAADVSSSLFSPPATMKKVKTLVFLLKVPIFAEKEDSYYDEIYQSFY